MVHNSNIELVELEDSYEVQIKDNFTGEYYEAVIDCLANKLGLAGITYINDFDSYYASFFFRNYEIVIHLSNFLGISIYFSDKKIGKEIQQKIISELHQTLVCNIHFFPQ